MTNLATTSSVNSSVSDPAAQQPTPSNNKLSTFLVAAAVVYVTSVIVALLSRSGLFPSIFQTSNSSIAPSIAKILKLTPPTAITTMPDEKPVSVTLETGSAVPRS
ncbi:hypothetical protein V1504DRAFT_435268 [Lipomyces starkeyi]